MPDGEKKGITVRIDASLHAEVSQYLKDHGMTMAEFVTLSWPAFPILSLIITLNLLLEVNGAEAKPLDRHGVTDQGKGFRRNQLGIGKVADRQALCAEVEILCRAEEGVAAFSAVLRFEAVELDLIPFYEPSDPRPELVFRGQQIQRRHEGLVLLVQALDCLGKYDAVFFISVLHVLLEAIEGKEVTTDGEV